MGRIGQGVCGMLAVRAGIVKAGMLGWGMAAPQRRYRVARHIGVLLPAITRKAFGNRGVAEQQLIIHWREFVGAELARHSLPVRLRRGRNNKGGVLTVRAEGGIALLMQHEAPRIIERINRDSGYELVARLQFVQGPVA